MAVLDPLKVIITNLSEDQVNFIYCALCASPLTQPMDWGECTNCTRLETLWLLCTYTFGNCGEMNSMHSEFILHVVCKLEASTIHAVHEAGWAKSARVTHSYLTYGPHELLYCFGLVYKCILVFGIKCWSCFISLLHSACRLGRLKFPTSPTFQAGESIVFLSDVMTCTLKEATFER